ncbi:FAD binding domain-containing protein [Mycolicibacterium sp. XJ879]
MLLKPFEYAVPGSVDEAVQLLSAPDSRVLAGGATLINMMKLRVASPGRLVDVGNLADLKQIVVGDDGSLELGAGVTFTEMIASEAVRQYRPILRHVASTLADVQVRNRATIGGNVCHNDVNNNLPPLMLAVGASMTIVGADGERQIAADEFFMAPFWTAVAPGELLTQITIPPRAHGRSDGWAALRVGADGPGIVNAAATRFGDSVRIALGGVASRPIAVTSAGDPAEIQAAITHANLSPPSDVHATTQYKRHLAGVLGLRAARQALSETEAM